MPTDPGFGIWYGAAIALVGEGPVLTDVATMTDGSIYAVGYNSLGEGWIAGFTADGMPHPLFEQAGVFKVREFWPQRILALPNGLALLGGRYFPNYFEQPTVTVPALAVWVGNDFDWNFGTLGIVPLGADKGDVLSLARFGDVLAASVATRGGHSLLRLDPSEQEVFPPAFDGPAPVATAFAADGSVVAVGEFHAFRFEANGLWDRDFGTAGLLSSNGALLGAVLPTPGDGFLVGGSVAEAGTATKAFVTRVTGDGRVDPEFPQNLRWRLDDASVPKVIDLLALPDGAAALAYEHPRKILDLVRFDWDGRVREEYGEGGVVRIPFPVAFESGALAVDHLGNVLVAYVAGPEAVIVNRFLRE